MKNNLVFIQYNEICFDYLRKYFKEGHLKNFKRLLDENNLKSTESEAEYENLEPWIQWPSIYSGLNFKEHNLFRLGDCVKSNILNIWDKFDSSGIDSVIVSPMNAKNNYLSDSKSIFIPDPWTKTDTTGSSFHKMLSNALNFFVNNNAREKLSFYYFIELIKNLIFLIICFLSYAKISNYVKYLKLLSLSIKHNWARALFLDFFLSDVMICSIKNNHKFATVFLNAGAHIQHHYFFSSAHYDGANKNPKWYCSPDIDPLFEVYNAYDQILMNIKSHLKDWDVVLATGLSQEPVKNPIFYWRINDHQEFLTLLGLKDFKVLPRMSRDFLVEFNSNIDRDIAHKVLKNIRLNGDYIFEIDPRERSIFVTLIYGTNIDKDDLLDESDIKIRKYVSLVALKNGEHRSKGYYLSSQKKSNSNDNPLPVTDIYNDLISAFEN